jgi:hypothetical protein
MHEPHAHTWELVLEPHSFPRARLLYGPQLVAFLFPVLPLDSEAEILADIEPSQAEVSLPLVTRYGYHFAQLVNDVVCLTHGPTRFGSPSRVDGWERQRLLLAPPKDLEPHWAPFLGAARLTTQGPTKYTATVPSGEVVVTLKADINVLGVPCAMPNGAAAWPQVLRLVLEMLVGTRETIKAEEAPEGRAELVHITEKPLGPAYIWAGDFVEPGNPGDNAPIGGVQEHFSFLQRFKRPHHHRK